MEAFNRWSRITVIKKDTDSRAKEEQRGSAAERGRDRTLIHYFHCLFLRCFLLWLHGASFLPKVFHFPFFSFQTVENLAPAHKILCHVGRAHLKPRHFFFFFWWPTDNKDRWWLDDLIGTGGCLDMLYAVSRRGFVSTRPRMSITHLQRRCRQMGSKLWAELTCFSANMQACVCSPKARAFPLFFLFIPPNDTSEKFILIFTA